MTMNDDFVLLNTKLISGRVYPEFFPMRPTDRVLNVGCGEGAQAITYDGQYGEMVGVEVDNTRLERGKLALARHGITRFEALNANAEQIPLPDASFDRAIAIDILEHVEHPDAFCAEVRRLLKPGSDLLITFPTMHDKYIHAARFIKRTLLRKPSMNPHTGADGWDSHAHGNDHSVSDWIKLIEGAGFRVQRTRATTMFPPLHFVGIPRFWFSNNFIHRVDRAVSSVPGVKNYGQTLMCVFRAVEIP